MSRCPTCGAERTAVDRDALGVTWRCALCGVAREEWERGTCPKCGSQTPIGHRCIVDDLAAIRDADLADHPLMHAIKGATAPLAPEQPAAAPEAHPTTDGVLT